MTLYCSLASIPCFFPKLVPPRHAISTGTSARQKAKKSERSLYTLYFQELIQIHLSGLRMVTEKFNNKFINKSVSLNNVCPKISQPEVMEVDVTQMVLP